MRGGERRGGGETKGTLSTTPSWERHTSEYMERGGKKREGRKSNPTLSPEAREGTVDLSYDLIRITSMLERGEEKKEGKE